MPLSFEIHAMRSAFRAATSSSGKAALMNCSIVGTWRTGAGGTARGRADARARNETNTTSVRCMFLMGELLLNPGNPNDGDRRRQCLLCHGRLTLVVGWLLLNLANDVHPFDDAAERRATLAVVEPFAAE